MYQLLKLNVLGTPLEPCYFGLAAQDRIHVTLSESESSVCIEISDAFLTFSLEQGIDLTAPRAEWSNTGLKTGDRWYIEAKFWLKAYQACMAPKVVLESTTKKALQYIPLSLLKQFSVATAASCFSMS